MIKAAYSKQREDYLDRFMTDKQKSQPKSNKPVPSHANVEDFTGPFAWQRYVLAEKGKQDAYQEQMRNYDFANSPEYAELYAKSRLPNGLVGGGILGGAGLLASNALVNKFGLKGWKKWLAHGLLGGGGALAGAYFGSKLGPARPDEYKNRYYDDNGERIR